MQDEQKGCPAGEVELNEPYYYKRYEPPWIVNFPIKDHWRSLSRLEGIVHGREHLIQHYREWGIT